MLATACSPLLTPTHQTITYDSTCAPICTSHGCDVARTAVRNHRATHTRVLGVLSHEAHSTRRRRRWACIGRAGLPVPTGHPSPRPRRGNHTGGARLPPAAARRGLQHHGLRRFGARDARGARVVPNDADSCRECKAQALTSTDKELVLPSERCLMSHWTHRTPIFPIMYGTTCTTRRHEMCRSPKTLFDAFVGCCPTGHITSDLPPRCTGPRTTCTPKSKVAKRRCLIVDG